MYKIAVSNTTSQIVDTLDPEHFKELDKILSYFVQGYFHTKLYKRRVWDGKKHLLNKKQVFPSGVLFRVEDYFQKENIPYQIEDYRVDPVLGPRIPVIADYIEERDYQIRCIEAALKYKNCIIRAATGAGKTYIASEIYARTNINTIIFVHSKDLLRQMQDDFNEYLGIDVGQIGDSVVDLKPITAALVQSASQAFGKEYVKYDDDEKNISLNLNLTDKEKIRNHIAKAQSIIFDEAHHLSADSCQVIAANAIEARYRIGLSGTPWRDDNADLLIEAATGDIKAIVPATELIKKKVLVQPHIFLYHLDPYWGTAKDYRSIYKEYITENDQRNNLIAKIAYQMSQKDKKVLVLVKYKNHGQRLLDLLKPYLNTDFVKGELSTDDRDIIKKKFLDGELDVLVATPLYDEGVNLPALDTIILAGGGKSSTKALQRIGRALRRFPGKEKATVIDFVDDAKYLKSHAMARIKMYKTEPGFILREVK